MLVYSPNTLKVAFEAGFSSLVTLHDSLYLNQQTIKKVLEWIPLGRLLQKLVFILCINLGAVYTV